MTIKTSAARAAGGVGAAGLILSAAIMAMPDLKIWEGLRTEPYADIVGVPTVCYGETRVPMRSYTVAECEALAVKALTRDFGPGVVRCVPTLAREGREHQLAASMLLSYNIGVRAFCGSTAARRFNAGQWRAGCDAFLWWNKAGGRVVRGLVNRRKHEHELCVRGLA